MHTRSIKLSKSDYHNDDEKDASSESIPQVKLSLRDLYQRHWSGVCAYIRAQFGNGPPDPEDVAQQAFEKLGDLEDCTAIQHPKAYLLRTAHNIVISDKRRQATSLKYAEMTKHENIQSQGYELTPERVYMAEEQFAMLKDLIELMPEKRREMLLMNRIHGMTYAEIARQLGVSDTAVKKQVYKAVSELDVALNAK